MALATISETPSRPASLTASDKLGFLLRVVLPTWAKGLLLRRRSFVRIAAAWDLDAKAVRFMQRLRRKYGEGPVLLSVMGRQFAILLSEGDAREVLDRSPCPFSPASREKRAALAHFEPNVSLIAKGQERKRRRAFNDAVLESGNRRHSLATAFVNAVRTEAAALLGSLGSTNTLTWPAFTEAWFRSVRRIVLGQRACDDRELTEELARLRARANWVYLRPIDRRRRALNRHRLAAYLREGGEDTLVELAQRFARGQDYEVICDQITHWLFAFDAGAITTFRALALLASHPSELKRAEPELRGWREGQSDLPYLRAALLEAVRLWPTTPAILRETIAPATCGSAALAAGSGVVIYAPFLHRNDERLACAHRFTPDLWLERDPGAVSPFVPFSAGPAVCPGRHLVTLAGSAWLAALLDGRRAVLDGPEGLTPAQALPGSLDPFGLRFRLFA